MPFLVALALGLHVAFFAPLFLLSKQEDQIGLSATDFLGWPLLSGLGLAVIIGMALWIASKLRLHRVLAVTAAFGLYLYLQFYLLVWDFGPFDGRIIDFGSHVIPGTIEIVVLLALLIAALRWPKLTSELYGRLLAVLLVACAAFSTWQFLTSRNDQDQTRHMEETAAKPDETRLAASTYLKDRKLIPGALHWSKNKNVVILLLDTLQVDVFEQVVNSDPVLKKQFAGFTLFTNASSHAPYTALSIPSIVTGEPYTAREESIPAYRDRVAKKRFEVVLAQHGFEASRIALHNRADFLSRETASCRKYGMAYDLYGFRQLPVFLKSLFYDEGRFRFARLCSLVPPTESELDLAVFDKLISDSSADLDAPAVKYLHFWGAHPPALITSDCQVRKQGATFGDFQGQASCILHRTGNYLDKLRQLGVFDKTMMFVISDHGSRYGFLKRSPNREVPSYVMSSGNPSLAFHDFGDSQEFRTSTAPLMLADIYPTIMKRIGIQADTYGTDIGSVPENADRVRPFLFFRNAGDAASEHLSKFERFNIHGNIHDPMAWSPATDMQISNGDAPLANINFADPSLSRYLGIGWSAEAKGIPLSWVISSPAFVTGRLPEGDTMRMTIQFLNPHSDQTIGVKLNGRELARWSVPEPVTWTEKTIEFVPTADDKKAPVKIEFEIGKIALTKESQAAATGIAVKSIKFEAVQGSH